MKKLIIAITASLLLALSSKAQNNPTENPLKISGYLETYYMYDFGNPDNHNLPSFLYCFNRHNEVNLNLGLLQAEYNTSSVRGKLALMTGTYATANLASESDVMKHIYEANIGIRLSKSKNLWLDAGVFSSHIGCESAIGANCWNMTRSIAAENSPYYLTGVKLSYTTDDGQWFLSGLLLNGWQRMKRVEGNNTPAFGHQFTWKPNDRVLLNSSSFIGSDTPDETRQWRFFHDLYGQFQLSNRWSLIGGFDFGAQQKAKHSSSYNLWYTPFVLSKFIVNNKVAIGGRAEYYSDKNGVMIATGTTNGFQTLGLSANVDVRLRENVLWRVESRFLKSVKDDIFINEKDEMTDHKIFVGSSLSVAF